MSDKPIENHIYSSSKGADYVIIVEKVDKKSNRIDFRYQGQPDNHDDNAMYFDDWEEGNYIDITDDITEETVSKYTVTIIVDDEEMGTASGGGVYEQDTIVQICATPNEGYSFLKWDDENTSNPREIKVEKDIQFTVFFEKEATTTDEDEGPASVDSGEDTVDSVDNSVGNVDDSVGNVDDSENMKLVNRLLFQLEDSKKKNLLDKTKELKEKILELADHFGPEKKEMIIKKVNSLLDSGISADIFHSR